MFVVEIDEKYGDQKKQMVTYIIGKAYDNKKFQQNIKKKLSDVDRQKKACFPSEEKKLKKNSSPPPPQISNGASLTAHDAGERIDLVVLDFPKAFDVYK